MPPFLPLAARQVPGTAYNNDKRKGSATMEIAKGLEMAA